LDPIVGLSSSSVPRDLLPDIQTEEDLQAIFETNYVSTDNTDIAISETEHNTETETDAIMSETGVQFRQVSVSNSMVGSVFVSVILSVSDIIASVSVSVLCNVHERGPYLVNRCKPIP
jgi:hypothetical protein